MRDALIDPRAGDVVRATPWERVVVNRCENGDVVFRFSGDGRVRTVPLYEWQQAMVRCKYRVAP